MKILFVAKHDAGQNDDEGAVAHALRELGHTVLPVHERSARGLRAVVGKPPDLCLSFKWDDVQTMSRLPCPRVFWYFDLVRWAGDPTLGSRCATRVNWMHRVLPAVNLGFCTDGDWVRTCGTGMASKLVWLPQGADGRVAGRGTRDGGRSKPLLFTGSVKNTGRGRKDWYDWVVDHYGPMTTHYTNGVYREELRREVAHHCITLAPDHPVTDHYWSNRMVNACGFGAFLLHPYSVGAATHYMHGAEVMFYLGKDDLAAKVEKYLPDVEFRHHVGEAALARTLKQHLYVHRVEELLRVVRERLGVS